MRHNFLLIALEVDTIGRLDGSVELAVGIIELILNLVANS